MKHLLLNIFLKVVGGIGKKFILQSIFSTYQCLNHSGVKELLYSLIIRHSVLKADLDTTVKTGTMRTSLTIFSRIGYFDPFIFHQSKTLNLRMLGSSTGSFKYLSTSDATLLLSFYTKTFLTYLRKGRTIRKVSSPSPPATSIKLTSAVVR